MASAPWLNSTETTCSDKLPCDIVFALALSDGSTDTFWYPLLID